MPQNLYNLPPLYHNAPLFFNANRGGAKKVTPSPSENGANRGGH